MSNIPKYARQYHDELFSYLCNAWKMKSKDLYRAIDKNKKNFYGYTLKKSLLCKNKTVYNCVVNLYNELEVLTCFKDGLHFCVEDIPQEASYNVFGNGDISADKDIFIDFRYLDNDYFVHIWKTMIQYKLGDVTVEYQAVVYTNREEILNYNKESVPKRYGQFYKFQGLYKIHISNKGEFAYEVNAGNMWMKRNVNSLVKVIKNDRELYFGGKDDTESFEFLCIPKPDEIIRLINHVMECYKDRDKLVRSSSKISRKYDKCKVHVKSNVEIKEDVYIPLRVYAKQNKAYENKGGTHASPRQHNRKGFFRKSRGRGNYTIKDGKFYYVGDMKGEYSYVSPTKVKGKNKDSETVIVYKQAKERG